ncbi:putative Phage integrase [Candidatus Sulfotelmatobacter kueseliae]|uniref:Putative Phage integrase n=1 Tax=Candidatus Sulfotelmatobacter kueseliae TaxID=2042962 RepID=A0A2U3KVB6_9BACT|nr:putative Phage integrase [Candidatus Sulfotelmatobacter kueseliae]
MGVKVRKRGAKWYVLVDYHGRRKSKCVGSREAAERVRPQVEAKLALGDLSVLNAPDDKKPTFDTYADGWLKNYAQIECKTSTAQGYEGVLEQYLRPRFGKKILDEIRRDDIKALINDLIGKDLSRNTIRNALCVIRGLFNYAIEEGLIESNPAARLGRFTRSAKTPETKGIALTAAEVQQFLKAAQEICPDYHPLLLMAVRAGLRRGELVAVQWGDVQLGGEDSNSERFILVQHNYVRREHTTTKSKKSRRVDLSRELRRVLVELRDKRLLEAYLKGKNDISDELVCRSPEGKILDPDNLYHRVFLPVLAKAGIRRIRLHDLRHTFGSLLIQNGASIVYVKEQMGHSSIQVTVDIYGHLIPGANVCFVDRLDGVLAEEAKTTPGQSATPAQQREMEIPRDLLQVVEKIGGGGWTRTNDLRIMRPSL